MIRRRPTPTTGALGGFVVGMLLALLLAMSAGAAPALAGGAWWNLSSRTAPTNLPPGGEGEVTVFATNLGDEEMLDEAHPIEITDTLPSNLKAVSIEGQTSGGVPHDEDPVTLTCPTSEEVAAGAALTCTLPSHAVEVGKTESIPVVLPPYVDLQLVIHVKVEGAKSGEENRVAVQGGETAASEPIAPKTLQRPIVVSGEATPFGVENYELTPENEGGSPDRQAGSHPFQLTTLLDFNDTLELDPYPVHHNFYPSVPALARDAYITLPPGLLANARAVAQCSGEDFSTILIGDSNLCPADTAVGVALLSINEPALVPAYTEAVPVFNLKPEHGEPARFGFETDKVSVVLDTSLLTGGDYAAVVSSRSFSESVASLGSLVTFWGVPGEPSHDQSRGWECIDGGHFDTSFTPARHCEPHDEANPPAYLTLPTVCTQPFASSVVADSWPEPGRLLPDGLPDPTDPRWMGAGFTSPALEGCQKLPFHPTIAVMPDERRASTPTGFKFTVHVPQETTLAADGLAEDNIKATTVALPEGVQASPGLAGGLQPCLAEQVGFEGSEGEGTLVTQLENDHFSPEATSCPEASQIGTVKIVSPLLEHPLTGSVYLARQDTNPFKSPLVLYLIAYDPFSGVRVKLAGEVQIDESTGQLTSFFRNTPPLPFETLELEFPNGGRAASSTPSRCGAYPTRASFTPFSEENGVPAAPVNVSSDPKEFEIAEGPNGSPCPSGALPFAPGFQAGSVGNQAGAFTPFTLTIERPDGDQALAGVTMQLPPGVAALIAKVTPCPEPPAGQEWACGADSLIGHATASSGLGPDPVTLSTENAPPSGHEGVYLTTGYDGAPYGLLVSIQAHAGPFELGTVNVRSRIEVNRETAAVTVTTDPGPRDEAIPAILKGVPVQLKQLHVAVDRPEFMFNPTNCEPMTVTGTLTGYEGASAAESYPFKMSNCSALGFAPKLTASVVGQGSKADGTTFDVTVQSPGLGQANIHKVDLTIPPLLSSRLTTLQKACLEAVFNVNPAGCDEGSVIGHATVTTPVFSEPLTGRAYLVSHGGAAFPDIEFVLKGDGVEILLDGKTQIKNGITYSRFESLPDAPFTKFESTFPAGPHSVLTPNVPEKEDFNLCKHTLTIPTEITAQDGAFIGQTTNVAILGCGAVKGSKATKLTREQLLAKTLKTCRTKYKHKQKKRLACEKQARKKYGPKAAKKSKKKKK